MEKKETKLCFFFILFILPLFLYLYLPIRAVCNPEANWGSPDNLERFISHITVKEYRHYFSPPSSWAKNFINHLLLFLPQFTWVVFILIIIGAFIMAKKNRFFFLFFGMIIGFDIIHSIRYSIHNIEDYYIPAFLIFSIFLGQFLFFIKKLKYFLFPIFLIPFFANYYQANRDKDFYSYDYGRNILESLEKDSIIFIMGDTFAFPLWYLHFVENVREDVLLIDKLELRYDWYCEDLKERYKDLSFSFISSSSNPSILISERFLDIVKRNIDKRKIYVPLPFADEVKEDYLLIPAGIPHKILPKNLSYIEIMDEIEKSRFKFKCRKTDIFMEERTKHNFENYAIAYEARARFLTERGLYNDAIFCLNEAIKINQKKEIFYNLGILYKDIGKLEEAEKIFKRIKGADGHYGLGMVYQKKNMLTKAIREYKKAISIDKKKVFIYHSLGSCYLEKGMVDMAISSFKDALEIEPNNPHSYYNLGVAYWKKGMIDEASSSFKKALEISPNYSGAIEALRRLGL